MSDAVEQETPRGTRIRLNRMERWCARHAPALGPEAVRLRALFEVAYLPEHADFLAAELRRHTEAPTAGRLSSPALGDVSADTPPP